MVGQILDYESKRVRNEALAEGIAKGRVEGSVETLMSLVRDGVLSIEEAALRAGVSESAFRQKMIRN